MSKVDNKKIAKNTLFLYFRMMLLIAINLYASRLVLKLLGVEDYGIYNIVGGVVNMFTFMGGAMTAATQRYLNYYLGQNDIVNLQRVFNASIRIHVIAALFVVLLCESIGIWFLYNKMVIPADRLNAAFWAFQCSIIATAGVVLSYPYNADIIAREKMSAFAYISIYEALMKLVIIYLLYVSSVDKLVLYATFYMFVQLSVTLVNRVYCHRHFEETKFMRNGIKWNMIKELMSFSGWNFLGNISAVLLLQGTNILLNLFFGPVVNAAKGISVQVQSVINQFFTNFQTAQNPQIVKTYAAGEYDEMHKLIFRSSRISFYLALVVIVPIVFKVDGILDLWLEKVPEYTSTFVIYTLMFSLIQTIAMPVHMGCMATGKVRKLMVGTSAVFFLVVPIGYLGLKYTENPVAIFQLMLLLYIVAQVVRVNITARLVKFSRIKYVKETIFPIFLTGIVCFTICGLLSLPFNNKFIGIACYSVCTLLITLPASYYLGMDKEERAYIYQFLKNKLHK